MSPYTHGTFERSLSHRAKPFAGGFSHDGGFGASTLARALAAELAAGSGSSWSGAGRGAPEK